MNKLIPGLITVCVFNTPAIADIYAVQLHVHGIYSEFDGSIESTTRESALTGIDVLWWSDHEFGFTQYKAVRTFDFEEMVRPRDVGETFSDPGRTKWLNPVVPAAEVTFGDYGNTGNSARISGTGTYEIDSSRRWEDRTRPLSGGPVLRLDVRVESGTAFVEALLSRHGPATDRHDIRYELGPTAGWQTVTLDLQADAPQGWIQNDNNAVEIRFGVVGGAAVFDNMSISVALTGSELYQRQQEQISLAETIEPLVSQHQGLEHEAARHKNVFSEQTTLGQPSPDAWLTLNHPFGTSVSGSGGPDRNKILATLLATDLYGGADGLEVGYRARGGATLEDHLWLWDQLTLAGRHLVGVGTSDFHGAYPGATALRPNNFVSWIYANSPAKSDLINGMRAGRLFFGDIILFDGTLDMVSQGVPMGGTVYTDESAVPLTVTVIGVQPGAELRLIRNGELLSTHTTQTTQFNVQQSVAAGEFAFVRAEVWTGGVATVFGNPIYFAPRGCRRKPAGGPPSGLFCGADSPAQPRPVPSQPPVGTEHRH